MVDSVRVRNESTSKETESLEEKLALIVEGSRADFIAEILGDDVLALSGWPDLAEKLGISEAKKNNLGRMRNTNEGFAGRLLFAKMLEDWKSQNNKTATLSNLLRILMLLRWRNCAEKIGKKFGLEPKTIYDYENKRIAEILVKDEHALNNWLELASKLGTPVKAIRNLEEDQNCAQKQDRITEMLDISPESIYNFQAIDVAEILANDSVAIDRWTELARKLDTSPDKFKSLQSRKMIEYDFPMTELFRELIKTWISTNPEEATEWEFIEILKKMRLRYCAEQIEETILPKQTKVESSSYNFQ